MAGLCRAGELVLQGQRHLLICETGEVGSLSAVNTLGEEPILYVPLAKWLAGPGAGDIISALLLTFGGFPHDMIPVEN
jgi:hypothetical protein